MGEAVAEPDDLTDDVELVSESADDEKTPTVVDPCPECGGELVRVKDDLPAPSGTMEEIWIRHQRCESTRLPIWSWCARSGWLKQCFDRRARRR